MLRLRSSGYIDEAASGQGRWRNSLRKVSIMRNPRLAIQDWQCMHKCGRRGEVHMPASESVERRGRRIVSATSSIDTEILAMPAT